ncbi:MAG: DUF362 domain-containing protein [Planctomycetes bacterium]|nr:DUF362 domain-containing protein [Planctomycetota bacterium]
MTVLFIIGPAAWAQELPNRIMHAIDDPLEQQKSEIWDVYGEFAIRGTNVHVASLHAMLRTGVKNLTGLADPNDAWRCFISDDDIVALKFTHVGGEDLGTNEALAGALLDLLYEVGFKPENFLIVGLDQLPVQADRTRPWRYGWQNKEVDFGADTDCLPVWLDEVTAIINIPSIMDDNIIGLRGSLANLSFPLLKKPARLYLNQGDPFIPDIYSLPQVRDKVRLHIANALRILYHGGPVVQQKYVHEPGSLIFSIDPVALDQVALQLLRRTRRTMTMPYGVSDQISAIYLDTAYAYGLGYNDLNYISYHYIKHEKWRAILK